jgi:ESS family glutamate:Na+ symporter
MGEGSAKQAADAAVRSIEISGVGIVVLSIAVLYLGSFVMRHVKFLRDNNIPTPVIGGILCSIVVAVLAKTEIAKFTFDLATRDTLLLVFFSTIGLGAKFSVLAAGGKALVTLLIACAVFLFVQNTTGIGVALLAGEHPALGLMGGSVSFAGGHGTAIAWGQEARNAGLQGAAEFGIACATFGLIAGGLLGGPIVGRLIRKRGLCGQAAQIGDNPAVEADAPDTGMVGITTQDVIGTLLALAICLGLGETVNRFLFSNDIKLPGFLTAMMVGIVLTNCADLVGGKLSKPTVDLVGDVSLQLFLAMSLMSMDLLSLANAAGLLLVLLLAQMLAVTLFSVAIVFRVMGRDYDAAVISAGFVGMGLGATPVAIANMDAVTRKFGPSTKAFLIVPLVGAFFIDLTNALVIKFFIGLPFWAQFQS